LIEKKDFTIIVIDDHHEDMEKDFDEIEEYLEKKGFKLNLLKSKKGEKVDEFLKENLVDIILADKNLGKGKSGEEVVKEIRKKKFLADILYYSGVSIGDSDYIQIGKFFSVEIIKDRKIVPMLKKMITKNLAKWDDVIFLRGLVISHTIEVEAKLNEFFTEYFEILEEELEHFDLILEGTAISLEGKKQALIKIIDKKIKEKKKGWGEFKTLNADIKNIQDERNILAHSKFDESSRTFHSRGGTHIFDKPRIMKVLKRADEAYVKLENLTEKVIESA